MTDKRAEKDKEAQDNDRSRPRWERPSLRVVGMSKSEGLFGTGADGTGHHS